MENPRDFHSIKDLYWFLDWEYMSISDMSMYFLLPKDLLHSLPCTEWLQDLSLSSEIFTSMCVNLLSWFNLWFDEAWFPLESSFLVWILINTMCVNLLSWFNLWFDEAWFPLESSFLVWILINIDFLSNLLSLFRISFPCLDLVSWIFVLDWFSFHIEIWISFDWSPDHFWIDLPSILIYGLFLIYLLSLWRLLFLFDLIFLHK